MKFRFLVFLSLAYLAVFFGFAVTWDMWSKEWPALAAAIVIVLTLIGAFIVAYWLIERDKLARESKRREQTVSTLKITRNFLLLWIYHYAIALSGHNELQEDYIANRLANRRFKNDINLLEYIFRVRIHDKNGNIVRGNYPDPDEIILSHAFHVKTVNGSLSYGLRNLEEIEKRINKLPGFLRDVDAEVTKITHLANCVTERIAELKEWESSYGEDQGYKVNTAALNVPLRDSLRTVGAIALDVMIAIEANLDKLEAESNR